MASTVQTLADRYKTLLDKTEHELGTPDRLNRLQRLGDNLTNIIFLLNCSYEQLSSIPEGQISKNTSDLLEIASKQSGIGFNRLKRIIGQYVMDLFQSNSVLAGLRKELNRSKERPELQDEKELQLQEDQGAYRMFLIQQKSKVKQQHYKTPSSISFDGKKAEELGSYHQSQLFEKNAHSQRVMSYLTELGVPQTELSYLCQQMGWKLSFHETLTKDNLFDVTAEVDFSFQKTKMLIRENHSDRRKKFGRWVTSFKILRRIYICFPEIWQLYESKRIKKSLNFMKNPNYPIDKVKQELCNEKVEEIKNVQERDEQFQREKAAYLGNIVSFKAELNVLNHQFPGVFNLKVDRLQPNGPGTKWFVSGELAYKNKSTQEKFTSAYENISSKTAEQSLVKELLTKVYQTNSQVLRKMIAFKNKKSIKT